MPDKAYRHQLVRDLQWLISSPPLLDDGVPGLPQPPPRWFEQVAAETLPWLDALDRDCTELDAWMGRHRTRRLGHHAEALVAFWLMRHPGITVHGLRVAVGDRGVTRGDLDLLFSCASRHQRVHWEMAVKFYLGAPPQPAWEHWIAPDPRDNLATKLQRIIAHQLPLGRHPIANQGAAQATHSEAFLKGWLFYPAELNWRSCPSAPAHAHPRHRRGWWLRHGTADAPQAARASRYLVLPRLAWLSPARCPRGRHAGLLSGRELQAALARHFAEHVHGAIIAEVQSDSEGWWAEVARGVVVHPLWPGHADPGGGDAEASLR